jgi:hypothetical protein
MRKRSKQTTNATPPAIAKAAFIFRKKIANSTRK